jgi:hypothetical protein
MVKILNFTRHFTNGQKYAVNFTYTDYFAFPYVSFRINLDAPPERPFIRKALVKCPGVRSGGRLAKPHAPATGSRSLLANVGRSWIVLPENVTFRGPIIPRPLKARIRMAV